ncbi:hypothetical protein CORC01_10679, partial [Colletotrichum orchidophilum]
SSNNAPSCSTKPIHSFSWTLEQCSTNYQSYQFIPSKKTVSRLIQTTNQRIHPVLSHTSASSTYQDLLRAPIDNLEPNQASHAVASTIPDREA